MGRNSTTLKDLKGDSVIGAMLALGGGDVYLVGGVLRNLALGVTVGKDYDFCAGGGVEGLVEKFAKKCGGSFFLLDEETKTYRVVVKQGGLRIDVSKTRGGDIMADLRERDFTVDAMALRLGDIPKRGDAPFSEAFIDPFRGLNDAKKRILRVVGAETFDRDPLRVLRGFRLWQKYGLEMERRTLRLAEKKAPMLEKVSAERIRDELVLIFSEERSAETVKALFEHGVVGVALPELKDWPRVAVYDILSHSLSTLGEAEGVLKDPFFSLYPQLFSHFDAEVSGIKRSTLVKLAAFLHDVGKPAVVRVEEGVMRFTGHDMAGEEIVKRMLRRLKFSRKTIAAVSTLVRNHHRLFSLAQLEKPSPGTRAHFFNAVGPACGLDLIFIALADSRATRGEEDMIVRECAGEMLNFYFSSYIKKRPRPAMRGEEVMKTFSVREGPIVGEIMRKLGELIETGEARTKKAAVEKVKEWLNKG